MAARPNTLKTLTYGQKVVTNQIDRLQETIVKAESVIDTNPNLTDADVGLYKASSKAARKMIKALEKVQLIDLPKGDTTTPRKGKAKAKPKAKAKAKAAAEEAPKKRGRPRKVEAAPVDEAPKKKRGRPRKTEAATNEAPKKRGRPKGSKNKPKDVAA